MFFRSFGFDDRFSCFDAVFAGQTSESQNQTVVGNKKSFRQQFPGYLHEKCSCLSSLLRKHAGSSGLSGSQVVLKVVFMRDRETLRGLIGPSITQVWRLLGLAPRCMLTPTFFYSVSLLNSFTSRMPLQPPRSLNQSFSFITTSFPLLPSLHLHSVFLQVFQVCLKTFCQTLI